MTKVAFILPTFPNLTGTFYMNEIAEVRKHMPIGILALARGEETQDVWETLAGEVSYLDEQRGSTALADARAALRRPLGYVWALISAVRGRRYGMLKRFVKLASWAKLLSEGGYTIIHGHFADYATEAAMTLSAMTGIPFSFTAHAYDIFLSPRWMRRKIRAAQFVVTCTEYNRRYMLEHFVRSGEGGIHTVYHGLVTEKFRAEERAPRGPDDAFTILSIGRMVEKKGMGYLVQSLGILAKTRLALRLVLVGDGPERRGLEDLVEELGLEDVVTFAGSLRHEGIIPLYQQAHCYVLPCIVTESGDRDGIPNTIAEAMSMELPVVSTAVSGIPELVRDGETGLVVGERDVEGLADAIARLAADAALCERLGRNARRLIEEVFDVSKNSLTLVKLFGGESL